jgi:AcrR family transcriptional regulator
MGDEGEAFVDRRARVLFHAAKLFEKPGFGVTSFSDVAEDAGLSEDALRSVFGSTEEIADALAQVWVSGISDSFDEVSAKGLPGVDSAVGVTANFIHKMVDDPIFWAGMRWGCSGNGPSEHISNVVHDLEGKISDFLVRGIEEGDIDSDINRSAYSHNIVSSFLGIQLTTDATRKYEHIFDDLFNMWKVILGGCAKPEIQPELLEHAKTLIFEDA